MKALKTLYFYVIFSVFATCTYGEIAIDSLSSPQIKLQTIQQPEAIVIKIKEKPIDISSAEFNTQEKIDVDVVDANVKTDEKIEVDVISPSIQSTILGSNYFIKESIVLNNSILYANVGLISPDNIVENLDDFTFGIKYRWNKPYGEFMNSLLKSTVEAKKRGDIEAYEKNAERYTTWADKYLRRVRIEQTNN